jgi:hypothetical protein
MACINRTKVHNEEEAKVKEEAATLLLLGRVSKENKTYVISKLMLCTLPIRY